MMGWFSFARDEGFPTSYKSQHTPANVDVLIAGLILSILILAISLFAILPAYSKNKKKALFIRIVVGLTTGGILLVGNYGPNWEIGSIDMSSPYKPHTHEEITGNIALHISLRGINITLTGKPLKHNESEIYELDKETINYNERFSWQWKQGRLGFGYYAGQISKDFRDATMRGVPLPILQIAEYFTFDGEGIRFGRYYRLAGWYAHLLMWTGFLTWLIANILCCMVVSSAAYLLTLTGIFQLAAIGIWTFSRNPTEIQIPFQSADGYHDVLLKTSFGLDYYLVLGNGLFCTLLGLIILGLDSCIPDEMCTFFGIDLLTIYDELLLSKEETAIVNKTPKTVSIVSMMEMGDIPETSGTGQPKKVSFYGSIDAFYRCGEDKEENNFVLKRRKKNGSKLLQAVVSMQSIRKSFRKSFKKSKMVPKNQSTRSSTFSSTSGASEHLLGPYAQFDNEDEDNAHISGPDPPPEAFRRRPPTPPPKRHN